MALPSTLRIAWRNLGRNRRRTALTFTAIAVAELALVFYEGLMAGYADTLVKTITGPLVGHVQVHAPKWREDRSLDRYLLESARRLEALRALPGVTQASARIYAPVLAARGEEGQAAVVLGVDFAAETHRGLLEGAAVAKVPGPGEVALGAITADALGARVGDELALVGQASDGSVASGLFKVVAVVNTQVDLVNRLGMLMRLEDARELLALADAAHELVVVGEDPEGAPALAERIAALPQFSSDEVLPWRKLAPELSGFIDLLWAYELFILLLVFVAAAAGAANTMMMSTFERTRELGMLLGLGAKPARVVGLVVVEGVLLGLIGLAIGAGLGVALVLTTSRTGIDLAYLTGDPGKSISFMGIESSMKMFPRLHPGGLWRSLIAVMATSLLAALWPAVHAARLQPVEAMRT